MNLFKKKKNEHRHLGRQQALCYKCGNNYTTGRRMWIDPGSLRRHMVAYCWDCDMNDAEYGESRHQSELRNKRTQKDWQEVTTPVVADSIISDQMPEQYIGIARTAIRAFQLSDATRAIVPDISPGALQETIKVLGLGEEMYAEQRDKTTVIRRVQKSK